MRQAKGFGHLIQETDKDNSHYHHQHHDAPAMYNTAYNMKCIITATLTITDQIHDNMATRNEVGQGLTKEDVNSEDSQHDAVKTPTTTTLSQCVVYTLIPTNLARHWTANQTLAYTCIYACIGVGASDKPAVKVLEELLTLVSNRKARHGTLRRGVDLSRVQEQSL